MEVRLTGHLVEVKRLTGTEDDDLFREVAIVGVVQAIYISHQYASCSLGPEKPPSMKSRASILTLLGLSFRPLKAFAVTIGYRSKSLDFSCGNKSVRCCQ